MQRDRQIAAVALVIFCLSCIVHGRGGRTKTPMIAFADIEADERHVGKCRRNCLAE